MKILIFKKVIYKNLRFHFVRQLIAVEVVNNNNATLITLFVRIFVNGKAPNDNTWAEIDEIYPGGFSGFEL